MDCIVTDFGTVKLSHNTKAWLAAMSPDWHEIVTSKKRRGKKADFVRDQFKRLEIAVFVSAEIEWLNGTVLKTY